MKNKKQNTQFFNASVLILIFLLVSSIVSGVSGCSSTRVMKYYARPNTDISSIKRIAVLPLEPLTTDKFAGEKIRRLVITEMLSRGIDVIEPGEVTRLLVELKVKSLSTISSENIKEIGETLGVDAVMMGSVEAFQVSSYVAASYPEVSISLRLLETSSSSIIWSVWHTSGGASFWTRHFGAESKTLSEAARKLVHEAIDTLF